MTRWRHPWLRTRRRLFTAALIDSAITICAYNLMHAHNFGSIPFNSPTIGATTILWTTISYITGRYEVIKELKPEKALINQLKATLATTTSVIALVIGASWVTGLTNMPNRNPTFLLPIIGISALLSGTIQLFFKSWLIKSESKRNTWWIDGTSEQIEKFNNWLTKTKQAPPIIKMPCLDNISHRPDALKGIVLVDTKELGQSKFEKLLSWHSEGLPIEHMQGWCEQYLQRIPPDSLGNIEVLTANLGLDKGSIQLRIKRLGDVVLAITILAISLPIVLLAAALVHLEDGGPSFYCQQRTGYKNQPFKMWKIRTMKITAESEGKAQWCQPEDDRITKIGKYLRLTRIDEIPQLVEVLSGGMSLIGPRPERPEIDEQLGLLIPHYNMRYWLRPGLSGWAQVNYPYGASKEDAYQKLSYDLFYIKNFSIGLDMLILLKTIKLVLNANGAVPPNN